ncbi:tRNA(Ile)-lysidine synthase (tRNA(Ile)-lysidinesynthetase) (tRNA(Ile)-2-lysyl-cytidine synthase) [Nautilia profundicola AmH]|uniref:tRNA(Ile)-lysidine synthase n=1 Tax=Nautilia profundicola (strain ATCC BAA-1463 / DSM 18972 / AmH) TaxID=598659 RepID=B9L5Z2_NAUPA|nr:tRNA lysidine(34) synthetase TilS [Nautilia profundicola]ACM93164.1 tRNA(Ile)-lysidine synthase (tRNA(Ile)-lysidinesynthetase) (tRNA(Ile)-2-lysyl-cytidine synthase) [Nautilia profundicola AmH]
MEKSSNNLLAFSAGVDSTALFFWLIENNIPFDIAIVNYHTRKTSNEEVEYAKELAETYNKKIYIKDCVLPKFSEKEARICRYVFFEEIIKKHGYHTLITAHQLNDRFEWFLMQFSKGAGLKELIAMGEWEEREFYKIYRPFYNISRNEIVTFLNERGIKYYTDESNFDKKYKRNFIRDEFSNKFITLFENGVKKSFEYLEKDLDLLFQKDWKKNKKLYSFKKSEPEIDIKKTDLILKELGIIMTKPQRDEVIKTDFSCVIQGKIAIDSNENTIYIAPYIKTTMDKKFKDKMRKEKIPPKVRGYLYSIENKQWKMEND